MERDDLEQRVAALERELAEQKRIAEAEGLRPGGAQSPPQGAAFGDPQVWWEGMRTGGQTVGGGPSADDLAGYREAIRRAAAAAGLSHSQIDDVLQRGTVSFDQIYSVTHPTRTTTHITIDADGGGVRSGPVRSADSGGRSRSRGIAGRVGLRLALFGMLFGICVGLAAALASVVPVSALWMGPILCKSSDHLAYNTTRYSYKPGQSGTIVNFECVGDGGSAEVNQFAIIGLQAVVLAAVLAGLLALVRLGYRLRERSG